MTELSAAIDDCPVCGRDQWVALSGGRRICLGCRHEWDPADVPDNVVAITPGEFMPPIPQIDIPQQCPACGLVMPLGADDVYHCPNEHDEAHGTFYGGAKLRGVGTPPEPFYGPDDLAGQVGQARRLFVGRDVVIHEFEQTGTVVGVDDDGQAVVEFGSGFTVWCTPDEFSLVDEPEQVAVVPDDQQAALAATNLQVVAQIVRAGAATLVEEDGARVLGIPPSGWLPDEAGVMPMVEWGAAYAVAIIADQLGMSNEDLETLARGFDDAARAAKEATGQ